MPGVLPVQPEIAGSNAVLSDDAFAVVAFDTRIPSSIHVPIRPLGESSCEVWRSALPVIRFAIGDVTVASNGAVMLGSIRDDAADTESVTALTYEKILDAARQAGYPHLLRIWNHVGDIHACEVGFERYRRFCVGRHNALTGNGYAGQQFPAASAVGMRGRGLIVYFLASRTAGIQVENPRQVAAYDYPLAYGPRSPSFSRATVAAFDGEALLFVSGTSSVVGFETRHAGEVEAQVDETLRNLERIVSAASARVGRRSSFDQFSYLKTYVRHAADYEVVRERVESALPSVHGLFLEGDICRRDLLVEIEGIVKL